MISEVEWWEERVHELKTEYEQAATVLALLRAAVQEGYDPERRAERPTVDARLFDLGTDVTETVRQREDQLPRAIIDVHTGGRT